ncbi:MAG: hypothetical protein KDK24_18140 [Pseudooceanicola sp.]|nr:hypothetical protein [Pseudooceanicola sp.]
MPDRTLRRIEAIRAVMLTGTIGGAARMQTVSARSIARFIAARVISNLFMLLFGLTGIRPFTKIVVMPLAPLLSIVGARAVGNVRSFRPSSARPRFGPN